MPPAPRVRLYKDFLTPALHRRFIEATVALTGLCYLGAIAIGEKNSWFWTWFPFGRTGLRTGLLFIPAFFIFLLRISQLHVGLRTSNSPYQTFTKYALRYNTLQTVGWYLFSAYLFSEIYIWSAAKGTDLNRIKIIPKTDRPTLNERPIFLTCHFLFLAVLQAGLHLFYDYDRIKLPVTKTKSVLATGQQAPAIVSPLAQIRKELPDLVLKCLTRAVAATLLSPLIYSLMARNIAWSYTRFWAKIFWNLPKSGALPSIRPFHWSLLVKTTLSGFLLLLLWEVGNLSFSTYVGQEPLKNDRPITYESKDPNGSLLTGLRARKLQTRAWAFWELLLIAERYQGRRKHIFEDIDRPGGSTWSQVLAACLETITGIDRRIAEYQSPSGSAQSAVPAEEIPSLPRIGKPINDSGDIFDTPKKSSSTAEEFMYGVGSLAKNFGQSPPGTNSPRARKLIQQAGSAVLTPAQQQAGVGSLFKERAIVLLKTDFGRIFRQEYRRRIAVIVLGSPYGDVGIIADAVEALTRLAVTSLEEDKYGNVQRDVKLIINTLTETITTLERFRGTFGLHWTDVEQKRESPEIDALLASLTRGLDELLDAFGNYSQDLRLSQTDMRKARDAVALGNPQMQQTGP